MLYVVLTCLNYIPLTTNIRTWSILLVQYCIHFFTRKAQNLISIEQLYMGMKHLAHCKLPNAILST